MRTIPSLAVTALLPLSAVIFGPANAQTGPLQPRVVMVAMPSPLPRPASYDALRVPLELEIAPDGRVVNVTLLNSSGDEKFDEKVRKYYSKLRHVPALDDQGTPITSVYRFTYKYAPYGSKNEEGPAESLPPLQRTSDNPRGETIGTGGIGHAKVFDEVDRITRMRCKDFLWEYDLMKQIAGAKPIYNERMLRSSLAMFIVHKNVKGGELNTINITFSESVREAVNQCRKQPDAKYFLDVLAPALETRLER